MSGRRKREEEGGIVDRTERRRGIFLPSNRTSESSMGQRRSAPLLPAGTLCASCKYLSAYCITRHDNVRPRLRLSPCLLPSLLLHSSHFSLQVSLSLSLSIYLYLLAARFSPHINNYFQLLKSTFSQSSHRFVACRFASFVFLDTCWCQGTKVTLVIVDEDAQKPRESRYVLRNRHERHRARPSDRFVPIK